MATRTSLLLYSLLPHLCLQLALLPAICGAAPCYADYVVFGAFQWARGISDFALLAADDPIQAWRRRLLDMFDGLARQAPGYGD